MQSALSRIWTRIAMSISYDDNHYTTRTSKKRHIYIYIYVCVCVCVCVCMSICVCVCVCVCVNNDGSILYKISFKILIKKVSESKKNKSINEKYIVCYGNKKITQLSCSKLKIIWKLKLSVSLINGDSLTFSLFLFVPCCCQCRFKRYIAKQTN